MSVFLTYFFSALFYFATAVMVGGLAVKIWGYFKTPAPLKIPTTPAPITRTGVGFRLVKEVVLFESLFKSNKWIWVFGWLFHFALFLVTLRHLRYFVEPVPFWVDLVQPFGKYAAFAMLIGLIGLLVRRIVVDRIRYISSPSDYLWLVLLLGIGISGALMTFATNPDIVMIKAFFLGLMQFDIQPFPASFFIVVHLLLVAVLMILFPFSKLLHAPGLFFSPSRNQVDNPREKRHIASWAKKLEAADRQN